MEDKPNASTGSEGVTEDTEMILHYIVTIFRSIPDETLSDTVVWVRLNSVFT